MRSRQQGNAGRVAYMRSRTFGTAASSAGTQLNWLWSRESLLRLSLSGVLALALWLYVTSKQDPALAIDYPQPLPITTANVPAGLTVTNALGNVHVSYHLDSASLQVTPSNFHVFVDLAGDKPGLFHAPVSVVADPGIRVVKIVPSRVSVVLDAQQTKHVPVRPSILTKAPYGYFAENIRIVPNAVTVSGPRSLVSQVTQASVELNLNGQTSTVLNSYPVSLEDSRGVPLATTSRMVVDPPQVQVIVPIRAVASSKSVPVLVPLRGQPKPGWGVVGVNVDPAVIIARGSSTQLRRLTTISTKPVWVNNKKSSFTAHVGIQSPHGITTDTKFVTVTTQVKPVAASTTIEVGITPQNVAPSLVARTHPAYVLVTVVGPAAGLRTVARQTQVIANLAGYGTGLFTVTPGVLLPKGFKLAGLYPATVSVQLLAQ